MNNELISQIKRTTEALLFASSEPLSLQKIRDIIETITPITPKVLKDLITELQQEYVTQQRAFRLEETVQGYVLHSSPEYVSYIELLGRQRRPERLSHAAAEVLSIIAYRQPITRPQIDSIRGIDSSGIISNLLERQLIQPVGKLEVPGRPVLYGVTREFLHHFGLREIDELPPLEPV